MCLVLPLNLASGSLLQAQRLRQSFYRQYVIPLVFKQMQTK